MEKSIVRIAETGELVPAKRIKYSNKLFILVRMVAVLY